MKKISGILLLLVYVCVATTLLNDRFVGAYNMQNITRWSSLFGILGIGVAFVIITGGIDLSIGSVVGLVGCLLPMLLLGTQSWPPGTVVAWTGIGLGGEMLLAGGGWAWARWRGGGGGGGARSLTGPLSLCGLGIASLLAGALAYSRDLPAWLAIACVLGWVLAISLHLGLVHGLLVTQVRLQPFVVTLCGLLIYRGLGRWITDDQTQGFGTAYDESLRLIATGKPCSVALIVALAGVLTALVSAWRLWRDRPSGEAQAARGLGWLGIVAGLVVALLGGVRFLPPNLLGSLSPSAAPGYLAGLLGWLVIPCAVWLLYAAFRQRDAGRPPVIPLVAFVVSALFLAATWWMIGHGDEWFPGGRVWAPRWRMALVFSSLGACMGAIAWFGRAALRGSPAVQVPLVATGLTAIAWLISRRMSSGSLADILLGEMLIPAPFFVLLVFAALAGVFLNYTIYGRYLLALGRNEQAARFSGIKTSRLVVLSYVICGGAAGIGGILFALDGNSVQPSGHGNLFELYAIAAAVLGGCSLRGGEGSILGVIIGATVMRVLYNSINILGVKSQLEYTIIGFVILAGVIVDETVKRMTARRRAQEAKG